MSFTSLKRPQSLRVNMAAVGTGSFSPPGRRSLVSSSSPTAVQALPPGQHPVPLCTPWSAGAERHAKLLILPGPAGEVLRVTLQPVNCLPGS